MTDVMLTSRLHKVSWMKKILESRRSRRLSIRVENEREKTYRTVVLAGTRGIWLSFWNMHRTCIMKHTHLCGHSAFAEGSTASRSGGTSSIQTDASTSSLMSFARSPTVSDKRPLSRRTAPRGVHRTGGRTRARTRVYSLPSTFTGDQWERIRSGLLDLRNPRDKSEEPGRWRRRRRARPPRPSRPVPARRQPLYCCSYSRLLRERVHRAGVAYTKGLRSFPPHPFLHRSLLAPAGTPKGLLRAAKRERASYAK